MLEERIKPIVLMIRRLVQAGELYTKELNKKYQVSIHQLNCLLALYETGPLPPSRIAKQIMVKSSTVTGIIDRLEQKGLVRRVRTSHDRRIITIELTKAGAKLAEHPPPPVQRRIVAGLRRLPETEVEEVVIALTKLTALLDLPDPEEE